jgi:hypothetical protein
MQAMPHLEREDEGALEPWLDSPDSRARQPPDSHQTAQTAQTARQARRCLAGV